MLPPVQIRPAIPADAAALTAMFEAWGHPQPAEVIEERLRTWAETPLAQVLVAERDGRVAGLAAVSATPHLARPGRFARVAGLAVHHDHRRRGVATALMRAAEDVARGWGCDRLELTSTRSRAEAPAFYAALGYEDQSGRQARYVRPL